MISKKELLFRLLYLEESLIYLVERVDILEEKSKPAKKTTKKTTKKSKK